MGAAQVDRRDRSRRLHRDAGKADEWEKYLADVREKNSNRRALRDEMQKAGVWQATRNAC